MARLTSFLLLFILFAACTADELCEGESISTIKLSFKDFESKSTKAIALDSIGFSWSPLSDTLYRDTTVSVIGLPVDPENSRTLFVFITTDLIDTLEVINADTLEISYKVTSSLISPECGPELLFSNLDTVYHTFDSLSIIQKLFDREVETNIEIFY